MYVALQFAMEVWGLRSYFHLIMFFLENGFRAMGWKKLPCGGGWWTSSMALTREVGVLMTLGDHMVWAFQSTSEDDGIASYNLLDILLVMVLKFNYGLICGMV
jgi:hypothetical protein